MSPHHALSRGWEEKQRGYLKSSPLLSLNLHRNLCGWYQLYLRPSGVCLQASRWPHADWMCWQLKNITSPSTASFFHRRRAIILLKLMRAYPLYYIIKLLYLDAVPEWGITTLKVGSTLHNSFADVLYFPLPLALLAPHLLATTTCWSPRGIYSNWRQCRCHPHWHNPCTPLAAGGLPGIAYGAYTTQLFRHYVRYREQHVTSAF